MKTEKQKNLTSVQKKWLIIFVSGLPLILIPFIAMVIMDSQRETNWDKLWQKAKNSNTIQAYVKYLGYMSRSDNPAKYQEEALEALEHKMESERQIHISIQESYEGLESLSLPYKKHILMFLSFTQARDIQVELTAQGEALNEDYFIKSLNRNINAYTGAHLSGSILLTSNGQVLADERFDVKNDPASGMVIENLNLNERIYSLSDISNAPFMKTYLDKWLPFFASIVERIYGNELLGRIVLEKISISSAAETVLTKVNTPATVDMIIDAFEDTHQLRADRFHYARLLGQMNDTRAVESLRTALNDKEEFVRKGAMEGLVELLSSSEYPKSREVLIGILKNPKFSYLSKYEVIVTLYKVEGKQFNKDYTWWFSNGEEFLDNLLKEEQQEVNVNEP